MPDRGARCGYERIGARNAILERRRRLGARRIEALRQIINLVGVEYGVAFEERKRILAFLAGILIHACLSGLPDKEGAIGAFARANMRAVCFGAFERQPIRRAVTLDLGGAP